MTPEDAKKALITVLQEVQSLSGLACPPLDGSSVPPKMLPKFDSTVWPAATTMVARKLGIVIPNDVHIFGGNNGVPLLTIEQSAELICKKSQPRAAVTKAA
jgi:hypothetical protein